MSENVSEPAPAEQGGQQVEERSLGDVLNFVADNAAKGAVAAAGAYAFNTVKDKVTGGGSEPPPPSDDA
jgi:hypothetical protein